MGVEEKEGTPPNQDGIDEGKLQGLKSREISPVSSDPSLEQSNRYMDYYTEFCFCLDQSESLVSNCVYAFTPVNQILYQVVGYTSLQYPVAVNLMGWPVSGRY